MKGCVLTVLVFFAGIIVAILFSVSISVLISLFGG